MGGAAAATARAIAAGRIVEAACEPGAGPAAPSHEGRKPLAVVAGGFIPLVSTYHEQHVIVSQISSIEIIGLFSIYAYRVTQRVTKTHEMHCAHQECDDSCLSINIG
jgi:hypothetical protein